MRPDARAQGPKGTKVEITIRRKPATLGAPTSMTLRVTRGGGSMAAAPVLGIGMGFRMTPSGTFVVSNVQGTDMAYGGKAVCR